MDQSIRREELDSADATLLVAALDAELLRLNPRLSDYTVGLTEGDLAAGRGMLLVARLGSQPVGCGAVTLIEPHVAEIKRMYVVPEHRRHALATKLLSTLESEARSLGATEVVLETATHLAVPTRTSSTWAYPERSVRGGCWKVTARSDIREWSSTCRSTTQAEPSALPFSSSLGTRRTNPMPSRQRWDRSARSESTGGVHHCDASAW